MKKWRRSARLVDMTRLLIQEPHKLIPLGTFAERYGTAKSSISEDLDIIHEVLEAQGAGALETVSGAAGGVRFIPRMSRAQTEGVVRDCAGGWLIRTAFCPEDTCTCRTSSAIRR